MEGSKVFRAARLEDFTCFFRAAIMFFKTCAVSPSIGFFRDIGNSSALQFWYEFLYVSAEFVVVSDEHPDLLMREGFPLVLSWDYRCVGKDRHFPDVRLGGQLFYDKM